MLKFFTRLRTLVRNLCTIVSDGFRFFVGVWRRRTALAAENLLLRKQLALFREREKRAMPTIPADRFVFCKLARWFDRRGALMIVKPATLIGWHRSVPDATLGTDRSSRFFHCRGVDCQRSETLSGLILPGSVHPKSGDRGIASKANGLWMTQIGRNATDAVDGILNGKRYLIHDRDPLFTTEFRCLLASAGVNTIKLPPQSPNLNAYAERFVRSIKESCLERLILFGEASLRRAIQNFIPHYHEERNHQGKGNQLLFPRAVIPVSPHRGIVQCQQRIGGLLKYYHREAV